MSTTSQSRLDRTNNHRYRWELGTALIAYTVMLVVAVALHDETASTTANLVVWMLPVVPALGVAWACLRMLRRADEFVRARQLEGIAVGFVLAMVASVTLGFANNAIPVPAAPWIIYSVGMAGWAFSAPVLARR